MPKKKDTTLNEVGDLVQHVIKHMATKEDLTRMATKEDLTHGLNSVRAEMAKGFAEVRADIAYIKGELADIKDRLTNLEELVSDHSHYTKEIDHAFARIAAIEKHLGIETG